MAFFGTRENNVRSYGFVQLLLGLAAVVVCAGCSCDSKGTEASIIITKPVNKELTYDDDADPEKTGFQYTVVAAYENLDIEAAVELFIDEEHFDPPVVSYPDEEEEMLRFVNVTLPAGTHELKAGSPTGSVFSDPANYTLFNVEITSPADGALVSSDSDSSEPGLQSDVEVDVYGFDEGQEIRLTISGENGYSETLDKKTSEAGQDEAVSITFDSVTLPTGEVKISASAELDDGTTVSSEHTVTVAACPTIEFVSPIAPTSGQLTLYADDDSITSDGLCGNRFGIDVAISTDAGDGVDVKLSVTQATSSSTTPFYTATESVQRLRAIFRDVELEDTGVPNTLKAEVIVGGSTCESEFPVNIVVDCSGGSTDECAAGTHKEGSACVPDQECLPTTCAGHGTCRDTNGEISCTNCDDGYVGDFCNECDDGFHAMGSNCEANKACAEDGSSCNSHGDCHDANGVVSCDNCDDGYTGDYCDECDANADDPCGDHGQCNDDNRSAMCVCDAGYAGDDCTDCAPGFHKDSGTCVLDSQCLATSCNGHGDCSVVDGVVTCTDCDEGYEGTFCHECDEGATDPCGDHGSCDDASGTAVCDCSSGYAGDECDRCASGFINHGTSGDPVCDVSCDLAGLDCGPGVCDDTDGPAVCDCDGTGFSGASCNLCQDDAFENNDSDNNAWTLSSSKFFTGNGVACRGDEDWFSLVAEVGSTIEVQLGFTHANGDLDLELWYEYSDPSYSRRVANSSSKTDDEEVRYVVPAGKNGLYLFRVRPVGTNFVRNSYSLFVDNRPGGTCLPDESCDPNPCQNGAGCSPDSDGDGLVQCACPTGYTGNKCESCAPGYHDDSGDCVADATCLSNTCAGYGTCTGGPPPTCSCPTEYSGDHCESCAIGFYRSMGGDCIAQQSCDGVSCGSNGTCDNSGGPAICVCNEGYSGEVCAECAAGYHDDGGSCVADTVCLSTSCDRHGSCEPGASPDACVCDQGYGGDNCETCGTGYHSSCYTCETLGVECGTWDDGCGGTITCGPCEVGTSCHEYWGVCADSVCDLYDTNCCVGNTMYYCYNGVVYPYACSTNPICGWVTNVGSKAGGYFACVPSDPGPPPDDRIQEECAPEWLPAD